MASDNIFLSDILKEFHKEAPISVVAIANNLGIKVYRTRDFNDRISGLIQKDEHYGGKSGYAIYTNASHPITRRRFTIAHEIGHFVLHHELIGDGITDDGLYRSRLKGGLESAANRFAANLLMPKELVWKFIEQGVDTVEELAKKFKVSESAMSIRLGVPFETDGIEM